MSRLFDESLDTDTLDRNTAAALPRSLSESTLADALALADIQINGDRPWDLIIKDRRTIKRSLAYGNLGLGESYMAGWVDIPAIDQFIDRVLRARLDERVGHSVHVKAHALMARVFNHQSPVRAWQVGQRHYDLSNDFYQDMLDRRMTYTCGFWEQAHTLDEAQEAKLDLICRKLELKPGERVLDIGCGWGSFMRFAAERYGVECVGLTISKEQAKLGQALCAGLPVTFRLQDYRDTDESFDKIVSIGMFEHVGHKNYATYMDVVRRCLKPDGLFLLHTIASSDVNPTPDEWIDKYIFPNGEIPSFSQIMDAVTGRFVVEDMHNFGADYDRTLMAWHDNFSRVWPKYAQKFGATFERMWRYYLLSCAGTFRARRTHLLQLVLSPAGVVGGYHRPA